MAAFLLDLLEKAQLRCLGAMTGQYRTLPDDSVKLDAGAETLRMSARRLAALAYERALRLPREMHPTSRLAASNRVGHFKRGMCCRLMAMDIVREAGLMDHPRLALPPPIRDPKAQGQERWEINLSLHGGSSCTTPIKAHLAVALTTIPSHGTVDLTF